MWSAAENMLNDADNTFITAGEFVYKGGNYPDGTYFDESLNEAYDSFNLYDFERSVVSLLEII